MSEPWTESAQEHIHSHPEEFVAAPVRARLVLQGATPISDEAREEVMRGLAQELNVPLKSLKWVQDEES